MSPIASPWLISLFSALDCFNLHNVTSPNGLGSRCTSLKWCTTCESLYSPRNLHGQEHQCGANVWLVYHRYNRYAIFRCSYCQRFRPGVHKCTWPEMDQKARAQKKLKQTAFRFAFFDIETVQCEDTPDGRSSLIPHYGNCIVLLKVG